MDDAGTIGIVTIVDNDNFGNRLQNYALQEFLTARGWTVETIPNTPVPMRRSLLIKRALTALRADGPVAFGRRNGGLVIDRLRNRRGDRSPQPAHAPARHEAIGAFTDRYIRHLDRDFSDLADPSDLAMRYERVIVGSDQVWNPGFRQANEIDFLTFVGEEQRVAYSASFGVDDVPAFLRTRYSTWLNGIPHISVREDRAVQIIEDLTGRHVPVVLDPTLLIDPGLWHEMAVLPHALRERRYLATFFLGGAAPDESAALAAHAHDRGLELIDLARPGPDLESMSPLHFIGALRGAVEIATDSFHASVFSLVFERPTITKSRHADDTRLTTLFDHAGLVRRRWNVDGLSATPRDVDWGVTRSRLGIRREESRRFLDVAVGHSTAPKGTS